MKLLKQLIFGAFRDRISGNSSVTAAVALTGVSLLGITYMQQRAGHEASAIKGDLQKSKASAENIAAIKRLESIMQPRTTGSVSVTNVNHIPIMYPRPYVSSKSNAITIKGTAALKPSMNWSVDKGVVMAPSSSVDSSTFKNLYSGDKTSALMQKGAVKIRPISPIYDSTGFKMTHFEVEAESLKELPNGKQRSYKTRALVAVPPPPKPACSIAFQDGKKQFRPSTRVRTNISIHGLANSWRRAGTKNWKKLQTDEMDAFGITKSSYEFATIRPLNVLDGKKTVTLTEKVELQSVTGEITSCSTSYELSLPPTCGIKATSPLRDLTNRCTTFQVTGIGTEDSNVKIVDSKGRTITSKFCIPRTAKNLDTYQVYGEVQDGYKSRCVATITAAINTNPGVRPIPPTTTTTTTTTGPQPTPVNICPLNDPNISKKTGEYDINAWSSALRAFEVEVVSRTPTESWICPKSSRCFAIYDKNNTERNLFVEVTNFDSPKCAYSLIERIDLGCFAGESEIKMADGSTKIAKLIEVGDRLWNPVTQSEVSVSRVRAGPEYLPMVVIQVGSKKLKVTVEHPIITMNGPKAAELIRPGDRILAADNSYLTVSHVGSELSNSTTVYNFEVSGHSKNPDDHMIEADGLVTGDLHIQEQLERENTKKRNHFANLEE